MWGREAAMSDRRRQPAIEKRASNGRPGSARPEPVRTPPAARAPTWWGGRGTTTARRWGEAAGRSWARAACRRRRAERRKAGVQHERLAPSCPSPVSAAHEPDEGVSAGRVCPAGGGFELLSLGAGPRSSSSSGSSLNVVAASSAGAAARAATDLRMHFCPGGVESLRLRSTTTTTTC